MHRVTLPAHRLVFPDRCLRCGAAPGSAFMMRLGERKIEVPLCEPCAATRVRTRAGWVVISLVLALVGVVAAAVLLEVILPFPEDAGGRRAMGMVVAVAILIVAGMFTWVGVRSALRRHEVAWDPVLPIALHDGDVELAFRDDKNAKEVSLLTYGATPAGAYRENAFEPQAYQPKGDPLAWGLPAVLALGCIVALVVRYRELSSGKEVTVSMIEALFFDVGGIIGVTVFWSIATLFFVVAAFMIRRERGR